MSRYTEATIENLPTVLKNAIETAKKERKGIFVYGGTGTGKTYFLHALRNQFRVPVESWVEIMVDIASAPYQGQYYPIDRITEKDKYSIDDIGVEHQDNQGKNVSMLYILINRMYNREGMLFLTTNLTLEQFRERYGDRILSRIVEMCEMVELTGEDKRIS